MTALYAGTRDGLYRLADGDDGDDTDGNISDTDGGDGDTTDPSPARVTGPTGTVSLVAHDGVVYGHDSDSVFRLRVGDRTANDESTDSGAPDDHPRVTVESVSTPTDDPTHLAVDDRGLVVGGRDPLAVHTETDGDWETVPLPSLPAARRWSDGEAIVVSPAGGQVSDTVRTADELVVAVERTGVFRHRDCDWTPWHRGLAEDVHDLRRTPDGWLAATGQGLYRAAELGAPWRRLDTGQLFQGYTYFHEFARHDGAVVTSGGRRMPGDWRDDDAEALLFRIGDGRSPLRAAATPDTTEYVWALARLDGRLYAGTATADVDAPERATGVVYRRDGDDWARVCRLPSPVVSLAAEG